MLCKMGRTGLLLERMKLWYDLPAQGFKTTVECPEPARSDCHAWGAHPIYHAFASILGIRPGGFGFKTVRISPQLGPLDHAEGTLPHPLGDIVVNLRRQGRKLTGFIELPAGLGGTLFTDGLETPLPPGRTVL
ncbi:MAG: alpha-L-rhamnosidase C-terminal domain-containing protein [Phycisphaeraceae bacterium]